MEEFSEIIKSYPGLVLTSENPMIWKGFLIVDPHLGINLNIKLIVPDYPQLTDARLLFGESISFLFGTGFEEKIIRLLENATTVSLLLLQLKRIVTNLIKEKFGTTNRITVNLQVGIVDELQAALHMDSHVRVSASSDLSTVKLSYDDVHVTMRKDATTNAWTIISSDLPELDWMEPFGSNIGTLSDAMKKLESRVEMLQDTWNQLMEIDNSCWVIDPPDPKPYHLYRRIKLTPSLSALITVDPTHVTELPDIQFLGSVSDVAKYTNIMNSQLLSWDPEYPIADNLRILFAIDQLPQPPELEEIKEKNAIVDDEECCICFSMELEDQSPAQLPVEICSNESCRRHFHTSCLLKWLQAIPSNRDAFGRIHGTCLNCGESISCSVINS